jgi:putative hemolysin
MTEVIIILFLLTLNGIFAMAEIALVSARRARLQQRAKEGDRGSAKALKLMEKPERFLSTVQVGITLVGVFSGAYGGASLSGYLTPFFTQLTGQAEYADEIAFATVVAAITYLSLIIGELVPKNLALRNAEGIASFMAGPMDVIARISRPLVWVLEMSTKVVMSLFGKADAQSGPTPDEVEVLIREGIITGGVHREESDMVEGVFDLRELRAEEVMRPKPKLVFLHVDDMPSVVAEKVANTRQRIFPVHEDTRDDVVGLVSLRELYASAGKGENRPVRELMHEPRFVSDNQPALTLVAELKASTLFAAVVADEFGIVRGLVTMEDLVEEVLGVVNPAPDEEHSRIRQPTPDTWLIDGLAEIDEVVAAIPGLEKLVDASKETFQTLAGFIVHHLERLPKEGESFRTEGYRFEVTDMDAQRIDKVTIYREQTSEQLPEEAA